MHYLPERETLLEAVTVFLASQVAPAIRDRGLRFRVQIAAHLLQVVYRELQLGEGQHAAEVARLAALLDNSADMDVAALRAALVARIEDPATPPEALQAMQAALMDGLADQLAVSQPRFDTRRDIENEEGAP